MLCGPQLHRDPEVLRDIGRRFGGRLALNAAVVRGGAISLGDPVTLVRTSDTESRRATLTPTRAESCT
jgi:hypothetical protein